MQTPIHREQNKGHLSCGIEHRTVNDQIQKRFSQVPDIQETSWFWMTNCYEVRQSVITTIWFVTIWYENLLQYDMLQYRHPPFLRSSPLADRRLKRLPPGQQYSTMNTWIEDQCMYAMTLKKGSHNLIPFNNITST